MAGQNSKRVELDSTGSQYTYSHTLISSEENDRGLIIRRLSVDLPEGGSGGVMVGEDVLHYQRAGAYSDFEFPIFVPRHFAVMVASNIDGTVVSINYDTMI